MAKALKVAAIVVGVTALAFTGVGLAAGLGSAAMSFGIGVSASTLMYAAAGLAVASALLQRPPGITSSQTERLTATIDPRAFRKEVLGRTAMATDVRYEEWHGEAQDYCSWIVCAASHGCESVDAIWLNDELAWTAAGGTQGRYVGYFEVPHLTLEARADDGYTFASGRWNGAHRLTGCCWLQLRFKVTGNTRKAESPFSGGPTGRMTIIGKGARLYDPRQDSTVPGGAGPMRWNDQSTWAWAAGGVEIGANLPLQILRRLLGWRITNPVTGAGKLATGSGLPAKRIDLASFIVAANIADEQVLRSSGGTESRYHGAAVISEGDDPKTEIEMLCAGCCGRFRDTGGKLALVIAHNDLAEAALDEGLHEDDVVGPFTFDPDPAPEACPNIVRGRYVDPSPAALYQLVDYPEARIASTDGINRVFALDLGVVESPSQAQRIARQVLQRKQLARSFRAPFDDRAWCWPVGKVVPFTFSPLGFDRQLFRVAAQEICDEGPNRGACVMELAWEAAAIYAWDGSDAPAVVAAHAITYDPTKNPVAQAIAATDQAAVRLAITNSFPVGLTITAAANGTITISDHVRRYTDGHADVTVTGATIASGLTAGTLRAIGYDDPDRVGGAVTYILDANDLVVRASPDHPGRHYVGYAIVPTAGSPPADGGGAAPPGGHCPTVDTPVLMADMTEKPAGDIVVGDRVWTRHEETLRWGYFSVEAVDRIDSEDVWTASIGGQSLRATGDHRVYVGTWVTMRELPGAERVAGSFAVVKITVTGAHTYVSNRILSHNIKATQPGD